MLGQLSTSVKVFYPTLSTQDILASLKGKIGRLKRRVPVKLVVLFGSYAKGNYTVASDIDVLIIYGDPHREEIYSKMWKLLNLPHLELHLYSESEYLSIKSTIDRMIREGIIIFKNS